MRKRLQVLKSILALSVVVFIPFGMMIWIRLHQSTGFAVSELIAYPLLFGGGSVIVIWLLKKYFLKEDLADFNSGPSSWTSDVTWGMILTAIYFALFYLERVTIINYLNFIPNEELLGLMLSLRENPLLLLLWFGPVLWLGVALYEELVRVFILSTLWKLSDHKVWIVSVILITSILMGLVHWGQGSYGVVTIAIKSLVSCTYFYYKRRMLPLVIAHALYDGIQVAVLLMVY